VQTRKQLWKLNKSDVTNQLRSVRSQQCCL